MQTGPIFWRMAKTETITVRGLEPEIKRKLRVLAAAHGRSMEQEVRDILKKAVSPRLEAESDLGAAIHSRFARFGGVELEPPSRTPDREPPDFGE